MQVPTHMNVAKMKMGFIGRHLLAERDGDLWEEETKTFPWLMARRRRKYRAFAEKYIKPYSLSADRDLENFDKQAVWSEYVKQGFATELMPFPWGNLPLGGLTSGISFSLVFKVEEMCAACGGIGLMVLAHDLGMMPLVAAGTYRSMFSWQRMIYKELKSGKPGMMAFAITEPGAGSDVEETEGAMKAKVTTRARKAPGGYVLNGRKCFISDGAIAEYFTLFACLENEGLESWTCFLVDRNMQGFSLGRKEKKMGQKAGDATELILEDVFVPEDRVIGNERGGWGINRAVLNWSRPGVGAIAVGITRNALEHCLDFCRNARLGNKPLIEYQDIQIELADMYIKLLAARSIVFYSARYQLPFQGISAASKVFPADAGFEVCNKAMEIMGDHGYLHGHGVEKAMRDIRLNQIYEGTNQINRLALIEDVWETDIARTA